MVERTCCALIIVNRKGNGRMVIGENVFLGRGCVGYDEAVVFLDWWVHVSCARI